MYESVHQKRLGFDQIEPVNTSWHISGAKRRPAICGNQIKDVSKRAHVKYAAPSQTRQCASLGNKQELLPRSCYKGFCSQFVRPTNRCTSPKMIVWQIVSTCVHVCLRMVWCPAQHKWARVTLLTKQHCWTSNSGTIISTLHTKCCRMMLFLLRRWCWDGCGPLADGQTWIIRCCSRRKRWPWEQFDRWA